GDGDEQPDVFAPMRSGDVLVHYPYHSFATSVERFVKQAVDDPNVLAIKMTVYRTSDESSLVPSLIEAAEKGKQAVCMVEHKAGEPTRIAMKLNSLVDQRCIEALYRASQAGVPIDLNIRGICCLRPGVPGVSETITVVSVVGRFLEHSRIYSFHRGDEHRYYIGSADLMPRNLD